MPSLPGSATPSSKLASRPSLSGQTHDAIITSNKLHSTHTPVNGGAAPLGGFEDSMFVRANDILPITAIPAFPVPGYKRKPSVSFRDAASVAMSESSDMTYSMEEVKEREAAKHREIQTLRAEMQKTAVQIKIAAEEHAAGLARLEREKVDINERMKKTEEERDSLAKTNASQMSELHRLEAELEQRKQEAKAAESRLAQANVSHMEEQRKLVARMTLLDNETGRVKSDLEANARQLDEYKKEREGTMEELRKHQKEIAEEKSKLERQKEELAKRDVQISELRSAAARNDSKVTEEMKQQYEKVHNRVATAHQIENRVARPLPGAGTSRLRSHAGEADRARDPGQVEVGRSPPREGRTRTAVLTRAGAQSGDREGQDAGKGAGR